MPKVDKTPKPLSLYQSFGVDVDWSFGEKDAQGTCPFCDKEGKFGIGVETGKYHCWVCGKKGNAYTFIRWLWKESDQATTDYTDLAEDRGLLYPETLMTWGVVKSIIDGSWLLPGYSPDKKISQLYRLAKLGGKNRLLAAPSLKHQLFGGNLFEPSKSTTYLCEGPWDAMVLYEVLAKTRFDEDYDDYLLTANTAKTILGDTNVLAIPGCNVPLGGWTSVLKKMDSVAVCFDNDHPRKNPKTGKALKPGSLVGAKKLVQSLMVGTQTPNSCLYLDWGPSGYDPDLPSGHDTRDLLAGGPIEDRVKNLHHIVNRLSHTPTGWCDGHQNNGIEEQELLPVQCDTYPKMREAWENAMEWSTGLDQCLAVMLASITSTQTIGDQLWIKVIGPAACGKSTLCEAVSVNREYVLPKSTIRGFHSGFKTDGDKDHSLISQMNGKTLVTKDGDTLLQSENLGRVLSEARDIYDGTSRAHYRNANNREYSGVRATWLLCGTSSLRSIDSSELGERFLDCVIMEKIDDDEEDKILWKVANRADRDCGFSSNGCGSSQQSLEMTEAMQLTGGYVGFLRGNAPKLLSLVEMSDHAKRRCTRFGKFVAFMRARPSTQQDEEAERELAARLVSQHVRLSKCLAVVYNKRSVDTEVLQCVRKVCLDTSRGQVLSITEHLYEYQQEGTKPRSLAITLGIKEERVRDLLRFMGSIGIVERFNRKRKRVNNDMCYRLTERIIEIYEDVVEE